MDLFNRSLEHNDLSEETYQVLKEKILRRQLKPGFKISINEVADGLGVSRTPVVVALQRLAGEGLVEIAPRRGTFVKGISDEEVEDVFEVRRMIELFAAQHILQCGKVFQFLEASLVHRKEMEKAVFGDDYTDYERFIQGDQEFHYCMICLTDNQRLMDIYRNLNVHMHVVRAHYLASVEDARQAQQEHALLLQSLQQGDEEQVAQAINLHIDNVKTRILQLISDQGGEL